MARPKIKSIEDFTTTKATDLNNGAFSVNEGVNGKATISTTGPVLVVIGERAAMIPKEDYYEMTGRNKDGMPS